MTRVQVRHEGVSIVHGQVRDKKMQMHGVQPDMTPKNWLGNVLIPKFLVAHRFRSLDYDRMCLECLI